MKFELKKYHRNIKDVELITDVTTVANKLNKDSISVSEYNVNGKYHSATLLNRFSSWYTVLEKAGLKATYTKSNLSDEELFENLQHVWLKLTRQPKFVDMKRPLSKYSARPYLTKFGSWMKALEAFIEYINSEVDIEKNDDSQVEQNNKETFTNKKRTKRDISARLHFSILLRDGFRCQSCGRSPLISPGVILHVDHIKPWSKGGETIPENLQTKCSKCNLGKGNAFEK